MQSRDHKDDIIIASNELAYYYDIVTNNAQFVCVMSHGTCLCNSSRVAIHEGRGAGQVEPIIVGRSQLLTGCAAHVLQLWGWGCAVVLEPRPLSVSRMFCCVLLRL